MNPHIQVVTRPVACWPSWKSIFHGIIHLVYINFTSKPYMHDNMTKLFDLEVELLKIDRDKNVWK